MLLLFMGFPSIITIIVKENTGVLYQFFSILHMFYYMRFFHMSSSIRRWALDERLYEIILSLVDIILFVLTFSCVFNSVEISINYSFLESVYFAIATITTTGYGDVTPHTTLGRLTTIIMMAFVALWLPNKVDHVRLMYLMISSLLDFSQLPQDLILANK